MKKSEQLDTLCKKLQLNDFVLSWESEEDVDLDTQDPKLKILFSLNGKDAFEWEFKEHHTLIIEKEEKRNANSEKVVNTIAESADWSAIPTELFNIFIIFIKPSEFVNLKNLNQIKANSAYTIAMALGSHNLDDRLNITNTIMKHYNVWKNNAFDTYIKKFMKDVSDDPYYTEQLLINGIQNNIQFINKTAEDYFKDDIQNRGYLLAYKTIADNSSILYPFIVPIIERIKPAPNELLKEQSEDENNVLYQLISLIISKIDSDPSKDIIFNAAIKRIKDLNENQIIHRIQSILFNANFDQISKSKWTKLFVKEFLNKITDQQKLRKWISIIAYNKPALHEVLPEVLKRVNDSQFEQEILKFISSQLPAQSQSVSWRKRLRKTPKAMIC
jgi:hypothetical protein